MKIAMLGAGAMGSLIGAHLKKGGADVILVDPYQAHMDKIRKDGLCMTINGIPQTIELNTAYNAEMAGTVDVVICLLQSMYTKTAVQAAKALFNEKTCIVTMQNGFGNVETLQEMFPPERIYRGVVKITSQLTGPGAIKSNILPDVTAIHIGPAIPGTADTAVSKELAEYWRAGGLKAEAHDTVDDYVWGKAVNNIAINAICAITGTNINEALTHPDGWHLVDGCLKEVIAVAAAKNVSLDYDAVVKSIRENTIPKFGNHYPSTAQDVQNKRRTDVDYLNGAICRYGALAGIPTPINECITALLHVVQDNYK